MRTVVVVLCLVMTALVTVGSSSVLAETGDVSMASSAIPVLKQFEGKNAVSLEAGRYPEFLDFVTFSECAGAGACANQLKSLSYQPKEAGQPLDPEQPASYVKMPGWGTTDVAIPERNRTNSKLLIFWTLRVEAAADQKPIAIDQKCPGWCGTSAQKIKGGQVFARLFINGKAKGNYGSITVPDFGNLTFRKNPPPPPPPPSGGGDPTISGSVLLTKEDFGGTFPAKISLDLRWFNATAMKVESPDRQRQIIVKVVPGE
ncbi:MAG: hypothetical protein PHT59_06240 [Candidatus Omnitrophica bacterium]|nr:hypothetical protein [Candidatus Omnitrophota bacterium]